VPLSARINGHVQRVEVNEGQMVHAGDVLAVLDQKEYSVAVYEAIANLAFAENTAASLYYTAAITVTTAYSGLDSAQSADSQVLQCKAQMEQAQLNFSNTIIRSPTTGIIGKRRIEVGQNIPTRCVAAEGRPLGRWRGSIACWLEWSTDPTTVHPPT
jgi:multidrug resistance efflux pump